MSIDANDLIEGLDTSIMAAVSGSQILQVTRNATPTNSRGFIIVDDATPDTVATPRYKRYGWLRPSDNPAILRIWNWVTSAWEASATYVPNLSITGGKIANGTIGKSKLANEAALYILRMNAAGTLWEAIPFVPDANSIDLSMFKNLSPANGQFLRTKQDGSGWEIVILEDAINDIANTVVDFHILDPGETVSGFPSKFLKVFLGQNFFQLDILGIGDISHNQGPGKIPVTIGPNEWEYQELPAAGGDYAFLEHVASAGADAGTSSTNAWQDRTINSESSDINEIVSLAANQFTLQAGTYEICAKFAAHQSEASRLRLVNVTDASAVVATSLTAFAPANSGNHYVELEIPPIIIASAKAFKIQQICQLGQVGYGWGKAGGNASPNGNPFAVQEKYGYVKIKRVG